MGKQRVEFSPSLTQFMVNEIKLHSTSYVEEWEKDDDDDNDDNDDDDIFSDSKSDTETAAATKKSKPSPQKTASTTTTTSTTSTTKPMKFQRMAIPIVNRLRTILTAKQKSSLLLPQNCIKPAALTPKENTEEYRAKNNAPTTYESSMLVVENHKLLSMVKEMDSGLTVLEEARDLEVRNTSRVKEEKRGVREEVKEAVIKVVKDLTEGLVVGNETLSSSSSSSSSSASTVNQHHHLITSSLNSLTSLTKPTTNNIYEHLAPVKREGVTFPTSYSNLDVEYKAGGKGGVMNVVLRGMAEVFKEF